MSPTWQIHGKDMAEPWHNHGKRHGDGMAMTCQQLCNNIAKGMTTTLQTHDNSTAKTWHKKSKVMAGTWHTHGRGNCLTKTSPNYCFEHAVPPYIPPIPLPFPPLSLLLSHPPARHGYGYGQPLCVSVRHQHRPPCNYNCDSAGTARARDHLAGQRLPVGRGDGLAQSWRHPRRCSLAPLMEQRQRHPAS